jgi:MFS family permease
MILTTTFSGIIVLALWLPSRGNIPIILFGALYGFSSGAFVSLAPSLIAQISDIRDIGVRTGTLFAIVSVAGLTGSPIAGALVAKDGGDFTGLQIFCGVVICTGAVLFFLARYVQAGFKMKRI